MKRPEGLKLKAPPFLVDLWWDLWDRRLLPPIGVVVVAIAAVPFLLGGSEESPPPAAAPGAAPAAAAGAGSGAPSLTVVEAKPGLRDYRRRLARRSPTDPFKQRYTAPVLKGATLNPQTESAATTTTITSSSGGSGGESTGAATSEPVSSDPPSGGDPGGDSTGGAPPSGGGGAEPQVTLYAYAINVRIVRSGGKDAESQKQQEPGVKKQEPGVKKRVLPLTPLPGEKAPVVTYMGPSEKGKPLLLVSTDVRSVFGEGKCVSGDDVCQLLEVEPGFPETFVYGANEVRYTINVLKIEPVLVGHA